MSPNPYIIYESGKSKSVSPFHLLIVQSDNERDPKYVPPGNHTPTLASRATWCTPKKVDPCVVIASQSDEQRSLTGTPSRSTSSFEGASGSEESSSSESAQSTGLNEATADGFGSQGATPLAVPSCHISPDEALNSKSTLVPQHEVPALVGDEPNLWCVGQ